MASTSSPSGRPASAAIVRWSKLRPITAAIWATSLTGCKRSSRAISESCSVVGITSALVLPSAFRPVPDPNAPTGSRWEMDPTLLVSAEVTNQNPFTVTYKIRPEAQWTDNAPIGADDFWYLWRQMVSQPGVVDPAGYDLITGVQSIDGGKQAVVTFSRPYPAWRELFDNILPAHIVKDVPGGFPAGLVSALPVTGGQFRVENIDPQRDEILLARNYRYWGPPAKPDLILFRRAGAPAALADSVRNGDTQVAQVHGGSAAFAQLSAIPAVRTARIMTPRVMQLTLRASEPKLADATVRKAILGLLDVDLLAAVGAGSDNTVSLDQAQIRSPSDPGYVPTAPPALTRTQALGLLEASGYQIENDTSASVTPPPPAPSAPPRPTNGPPEITRGRISKNGKQLSLIIGVAANDPTSVAVANTAADQLRNVGIAATIFALDPVALYREALVNNRVDALVGWREAGEKERVWVCQPGHPIARDLPAYFEIPHEEMYSEPFGIPNPDELVFISWFQGGEVFRSGCCWRRGAGKIFYFRPGHETFPTYKQQEVLQVIRNGIGWATPDRPRWIDACPNIKVSPEGLRQPERR